MKEILCITTYPPRECGIATFSEDLIKSIHHKFGKSYVVRIAAVESFSEQHVYEDIVKHRFNTSDYTAYKSLAETINNDSNIHLVLIQHEFGLYKEHEQEFLVMLSLIKKPIVLVFHTVLSKPEAAFEVYVRQLVAACKMIVVMTNTSLHILHNEYEIDESKIVVIPHGTHLVLQQDKKTLKRKYAVTGRRVLSTFGLLGAGKSIETSLDAMPAIVARNPTVLFLIIGKTHPSVIEQEGERYREMLEKKVTTLNLAKHVRFVNAYLSLPILLEYLQLTDVYLFTSCDPNQAVSGTFVYALSCGCPIVATPIPHALEWLNQNTGLFFDFKDSNQLALATNRLLANETLRSKMKTIGLQKTMATAWENTATAHTLLFHKMIANEELLQFSLPDINSQQIRRMSQHFGIIQFSVGNRPDLRTGYTIDDNARALTATCEGYNLTAEEDLISYIKVYLTFILYCQQPDGLFLNYVDSDRNFTIQNNEVNLDDSNGRAIYALGHFIGHGDKFENQWTLDAQQAFTKALPLMSTIYSPRSIAFMIKGLCDYSLKYPADEIAALIETLANRLVGYYEQHAVGKWYWFEDSLTYDNSVLPESLLYAYRVLGDERYKRIAKESFDFLVRLIFIDGAIKVISNDGWRAKGADYNIYGEQPIDVASVVVVLSTFYDIFRQPVYLTLRAQAFNWFLGNNHLHQTIFNPATGGCCDGLEEYNVNINQGSESTVCYYLARLKMEMKF